VPEDIDRLVELDSDPEVMRYITYGRPTPRERYEREIIPRWLAFECDFVYPEDILAGRSEAERAAVKYSITRPRWLAQRA
jgi:RimJ/RimL family protein N-acetyltransferase